MSVVFPRSTSSPSSTDTARCRQGDAGEAGADTYCIFAQSSRDNNPSSANTQRGGSDATTTCWLVPASISTEWEAVHGIAPEDAEGLFHVVASPVTMGVLMDYLNAFGRDPYKSFPIPICPMEFFEGLQPRTKEFVCTSLFGLTAGGGSSSSCLAHVGPEEMQRAMDVMLLAQELRLPRLKRLAAACVGAVALQAGGGGGGGGPPMRRVLGILDDVRVHRMTPDAVKMVGASAPHLVALMNEVPLLERDEHA